MNQQVISFDAAVNVGTNTGTIRIKMFNGQIIPFQNLSMDVFNGMMHILNESPVYFNPVTKNIYTGAEHVA